MNEYTLILLQRSMTMLYKQMLYFISVVDCNSFTGAAEQNYISQSAISQQIKALEQDLGVTLLVRENRKFQLTPSGEYFYRSAKELLSEVEAIKRETVRIGNGNELSLKIGYLRCYNGLELQQAVEEFSRIYPEVAIDIANGTHEELYDLLRFNKVDLVLNDQRRAFSDDYVNCELLQCDCYAEISIRNPFCSADGLHLEELKRTPCILIATKGQQEKEADFYHNTLGFHDHFIFAETLEEGRLMVAANRGYLPIDGVGTMLPPSSTIRRLPLFRANSMIKRNYCTFWQKERSNYYIEEFATILCKLFGYEE